MMSMSFRTFVLSIPVLIVLGSTEEVRAQPRGHVGGLGIGVGVGYGIGPTWGRPYYGPYWGGFAYQPPYNFYNGTWGNGLSLYGPPVPTGKPIPGMLGGGDSQFFAPAPFYPGWGYIPLSHPGHLPAGVFEPGEMFPPPAPFLNKPAAMEMEVRLPSEEARVFIDGEPTKATGAVRVFRSPSHPTAESLTYDLRVEWKVDGLTTTHAKRVTGRAGERVVVDFAK
ncbi:MAG: TIGR03000 domain-containing protein [Gemmataceae bacterium]|nr:TIGR03000 domain-containing protein [Gemmataceae bacterium]